MINRGDGLWAGLSRRGIVEINHFSFPLNEYYFNFRLEIKVGEHVVNFLKVGLIFIRR